MVATPLHLGVVGGTRSSSGAFDPQGPAARSAAELWWFMLGLGGLVLVLVLGLLVLGLARRGPRPAADDLDVAALDRRLTRRWVLYGGAVMPAVVIMVVFGATVAAMREVRVTAPAGALEVDVIGHQWWWEVRYPGTGVTTANELHLPVGRPVALRLAAADVIHSFWVPALGGKMDLLPDGTNTLVLQADEAGVHRSLCAEFCGLQHARMGLVVVAEPEADFAAWLDGQRAPAAAPTGVAARRGREVFTEGGCGACHTVRGTDAAGREGPDLTHLASRPTLGAGALGSSPEELAQWVTDPHVAKVGVDMPATELPPADLDALVAYLDGLR